MKLGNECAKSRDDISASHLEGKALELFTEVIRELIKSKDEQIAQLKGGCCCPEHHPSSDLGMTSEWLDQEQEQYEGDLEDINLIVELDQEQGRYKCNSQKTKLTERVLQNCTPLRKVPGISSHL